jgi:hypothetical protein
MPLLSVVRIAILPEFTAEFGCTATVMLLVLILPRLLPPSLSRLIF